YVEALHGSSGWGKVLDAGTGWGSLEWLTGLASESLTAVTGDASWKERLERDFGPRLRAQDRLVVGNWTDPRLLAGERFEVVLLDYLVGAVDRLAPYYQTRLLGRIKNHVAGRIYLIGLEPYPPAGKNRAGRLVNEIANLRDSILLLAQQRPHREYPRWWVLEQLALQGYEVISERAFPILYGEAFVRAELDVCRRALKSVPVTVQASLDAYERELRQRALDYVAEQEGGLAWGADYVIAARVGA
ncbi:MAG: class I SAM-dependent methyltransferase, partial [Candidatus Eremiobacteraeota bacterium]|nr:class I SAM-dependent methyltransferase [Candidatus Eremiobacteraeota bacterium]